MLNPLVFAQSDLPLSSGGFFVLVMIVLAVISLFGFLMLFASRYKRCPSNRILVIYGSKTGGDGTVKCLHGGAKFVWPLIQDYNYLNLEPVQIEIPLRGALSAENIRVSVPSVFTVAIGVTPEVMHNAAVRLLGLKRVDIEKQAQEIIFGQLRQVIASMRIEDINRDRDTFLTHIQNSLEPELKKIGLVLINVNITDITDESGYIDAIGQKAASQAIQQARGDVAEQLRLGETRVAEAERDKVVQISSATKEREIGIRTAERDQAIRVAELEKERQIGMQSAARELAVRVAELDKEKQIAEQTAAFQREAQVKTAEQDMRIRTAEANARAVEGENISQAAIAKSKAELAVRNAEAYQIGETRRREAEASVLEAQHRAMAKAALADAERIEAEKRASLEAVAKAEKAKMIVDAQASAEKRKIEAEGEASAIYAKFEAEARGQYEVLAKKGEGLKQIIDACGGAQQAFQLLMLEHIDKMAEASATAISNIKFDKIVVWDGGNSNGHGGATANFLQSMSRSLPPMMQVMKDIAGIELPETLLKVAGDEPSPNGHVDLAPAGSTGPE
ncbi:flotillin family protein [Planctellipticum variicoloris]|uniref:flotillin family protein n=1 Tax=Planctellipticum variicoloris TaxID=3064265 RepID=UPI0030134DC3|nr:SPFH domain-containing protein [Planctomycetaceae bacterium SH412]